MVKASLTVRLSYSAKNLRSSFENLRTNGRRLETNGDSPFMLSLVEAFLGFSAISFYDMKRF
jgi:hypothetical protein